MSNAENIVSRPNKDRLVSLDALRGFDMFWIIGAGSIAKGLVNLKLPWSSFIAGQLAHSKWNGFTFYDLIFPLFVFITGVSLVLSLKKRLEKDVDRQTVITHVLKRSVILFMIGIIYYDQFSWPMHWERIRVMGVLQRISICYFIGSMLVLYTRPRTQALTAAGILIGYWAIMRFIPVPGYGAGIWTEQHNLPRYIDNLLLPGRLFYGSWDPEGLLTTIPAVATCLLGVLAGHWLKTVEWGRFRIKDANQRAIYLFLAGLVLAVLGALLNPLFPINKNLWTSSFVLLTGGLSAMLLAAGYWAIDIRGHRLRAFPFIVIGMNSIFIYFAVRFVPFAKLAAWAVQANPVVSFGRGRNLAVALLELAIEGLLLFWLYRRKIFIRI